MLLENFLPGPVWLSALVGIILVGGGCTRTVPSAATYLDRGVGRVSQSDVQGKFGPPLMQVPADHGVTIWIYRYAGIRAAGPTAVEELWCFEHALTFGSDRVLQGWTRQDCQQSHAMP